MKKNQSLKNPPIFGYNIGLDVCLHMWMGFMVVLVLKFIPRRLMGLHCNNVCAVSHGLGMRRGRGSSRSDVIVLAQNWVIDMVENW